MKRYRATLAYLVVIIGAATCATTCLSLVDLSDDDSSEGVMPFLWMILGTWGGALLFGSCCIRRACTANEKHKRLALFALLGMLGAMLVAGTACFIPSPLYSNGVEGLKAIVTSYSPAAWANLCGALFLFVVIFLLPCTCCNDKQAEAKWQALRLASLPVGDWSSRTSLSGGHNGTGASTELVSRRNPVRRADGSTGTSDDELRALLLTLTVLSEVERRRRIQQLRARLGAAIVMAALAEAEQQGQAEASTAQNGAAQRGARRRSKVPGHLDKQLPPGDDDDDDEGPRTGGGGGFGFGANGDSIA